MPPKGKLEKNIDDINSIRCPMCGKRQSRSNYYKSTSSLFKNNNEKMIWCKQCVWDLYDDYFNMLKDIRMSVYITCMKLDIPFNEPDYEGMIKQLVGNNTSHPMKIYMQKINSLGSFNNGLSGFDPKYILEKEININDNNNHITKDVNYLEYNIELTEQDLQVKEDVIRLIGYDPFAGYSNFDQKFLYNELISYLDEDTLDDAFKLSQVLQLVNNNNQVRKIDIVISSMSNDTKSLIANQGEIKNLTATKKTIVDNTDKIAKENSISVKNRGDKTAGKSTITYLMKNYRELGFEDAEQDYYDQKKAYGMKLVADISNKSMLEQLQFDENDINDIFLNQKQMLQNLQDKVLDLEEENRQLHSKIGSLSSKKEVLRK